MKGMKEMKEMLMWKWLNEAAPISTNGISSSHLCHFSFLSFLSFLILLILLSVTLFRDVLKSPTTSVGNTEEADDERDGQ